MKPQAILRRKRQRVFYLILSVLVMATLTLLATLLLGS